jgi:hypothetical protein
VEWTTEIEQAPPAPQPSLQTPVEAPQPSLRTPVTAPASSGLVEHCPSCGASVAGDQRYCLECGLRRGEPRLPFMEAVVFMEAMNQPPETTSAPRKQKRRISPNTALIAGVGTLLLALGIGVLIGRSGNHSSAPATQAPIVIRSGSGEEAKTASATGATTIGGTREGGKPKKKIVKAKQEAAETGQGAKEVLKPKAGVKLPPATAQPGDKCEEGTEGCEGGEFTGSFFGE